MSQPQETEKVVPLRKPDPRSVSSHQRIWGKAILSHGYAGIPSILIQAQRELRLNAIKMNIVVQLLDDWRDPDRHPFPRKRELAQRIGVTDKTIQNNIRALERAGLIQRQIRRSSYGDYTSNVYRLDGLVQRLKELEPEFARERQRRREARGRVGQSGRPGSG